MLRRVVGLALRWRGVVIAIASLVILYGVYAIERAPLDVFPEFAPPEVEIQTEAPGLSPEQVEQLVTQRIENTLAGTAGLESIRSRSIQGLSVVTMIFHSGVDIFRARQMVGERLPQLANQIPQGLGAPVMAPLTSTTAVIMAIGLTSETRSLADLRTFATWTIRPRLLSVPGVANVVVYGGGDRQLQIQVEPKLLLAYGVSLSDILAAARTATGVRGAGFVETANQRIVIRSQGQSLTPGVLRQAVLREAGPANVRLGDVATVQWAAAPPFGGGLIMGRPGIILQVSTQYGANTLEVTAGVDRALKDLRPAIAAEGATLHPQLFRAATFIDAAIGNLRGSILLGALLVAIVLVLFLYNLRTAFISLTAIPLSLLIAIIVLQQAGASLNTLTLGGLAIAIGEVVDDAIIDVENVFRRLRENRSALNPRRVFDVILEGSLEVRSAVVYATFVVALVFFPVLRMSGVQGRLFSPLGWAYILAIMASLAVALTVTPALCFVLLPDTAGSAETAFVRRLKEAHRHALASGLEHPALVIISGAALCIAAVAILPFFGGGFIPELKERSFILHMASVPGTSLGESLRIGGNVTKALLHNPSVEAVAQRAGRAELGEDTFGPHQSEFDLRLKPLEHEDLDLIQDQLRRTLGDFPGYDFSMNSYLRERIDETLSGAGADVVFKLFSNDVESAGRAAASIARVLSPLPGAADVRIAAPGGMPQMLVQLEPERLAQFGFRPADLLDVLQTAYQGSIAAQIYDGNRFFDVAVILDPASRRDPESLKRLIVRNRLGASMALSELASVRLAPGPYELLHDGARRVQLVTCNVVHRDLASFAAQAEQAVRSKVALPPGSYLEVTGAAQARATSTHEILMNSLISGIVIICLLYVALGTLPNLMLVLANVPFALVGGVLAAALSGGQLSLGSIVGFVTLFGITMRNSIMLVSHFEHLVSAEGATWGPETALRGASERLLPILMTALVTGLGLLPMALGSGTPGREIEGPMAIIILGGLLTSTLLNLVLLPVLALRFGRFGAASVDS
jgi:CzcA family heavy metal efflux pump